MDFVTLPQNYPMKRVFLFLICLPALLLTSCSDYIKVQKTTDPVYKYEAAKQYYAAGEYNRAATFLQELINMLKGTEKGEESLFLLAMSSYKAHDYNSATSYFRKYYQSYPDGIYTEKAHYYCGMSLFNSVPEIKLDQTATFEASTEFQNFLELYPNSQLSEQAQANIFKLQDRLVEKEYLSAKLYYDLGSYFGNCTNGGSNYQACIVTAENAIQDFPYMSRREDFAILILRAKFDLAKQSVESKKEERYHDAIDEYYGFTNEYPESKYLKEAQEMFNKAKKYTTTDNEDETAEPTGETPAAPQE